MQAVSSPYNAPLSSLVKGMLIRLESTLLTSLVRGLLYGELTACTMDLLWTVLRIYLHYDYGYIQGSNITLLLAKQ